MKLLALDTSGATASVALLDSPARVEQATITDSGEFTVLLPQVIHSLLTRAGWRAAELDLLAVTTGPGSFTGLRIGLGIIQGLSLAHSLPVVGYSTLELLALAHGAPGQLVLCLLPAKRSEFFLGAWRITTPPREELSPRLATRSTVEELLTTLATGASCKTASLPRILRQGDSENAHIYVNMLRFSKSPFLGCGAMPPFCNRLTERAPLRVGSGWKELGTPPPANSAWPPAVEGEWDAATLGAIALAGLGHHPAGAAAGVEPLYLRPADAVPSRGGV